ncbi:MAG: DUF692 domain-containing protein [Pseudomonadota bacterium]
MSNVTQQASWFGLGLKAEHYQTILTNKPKIDFFEIISENFFALGGKPHYYLELIRQDYPLVMHGVSLSLGSTDALNWDYLNQIKQLSKRIEARWISDHLCWTGIDKVNTHDLLPLPYTQEAIEHVVKRIQQVQDYLGQRILIENVSSYLTYQTSQMPEWEFLNTIAKLADCYILLDINNIYVSSQNHQFDPLEYLKAIDPVRVKEHHLAGHSNFGDYIIDTHDQAIIKPVWELYLAARAHFGSVPTLIERDDNIPELTVLLNELQHCRQLAAQVDREGQHVAT